MAILVTGGAGFIGSHTCVELLNAGYDVVIADNLYNASEKAVDRVKQITGKDLKFYKADIRDKEAMNEIFEKEEIESVIHFAGLKAVGESVVKPLEYYENNIAGTLVLCDVMRNHGVKNIIFSSSATVYGDPAFIPVSYTHLIWMRRATSNSIRQVFWHIPMENILDLEKRSEHLDTA